MSGHFGGFGDSGGWASRADSGRGWGSMDRSGFSGGRFGGGGFGGGGFRGVAEVSGVDVRSCLSAEGMKCGIRFVTNKV